MKKVNNILSSVCKKERAKRCAAAVSAAVAVVSSLSFTFQYTAEAKSVSEVLVNGTHSREILELSESFLSLRKENNISVLDASGFKPEEESVLYVEEFTNANDSESKREVETEIQKVEVTEDQTEKENEKTASEATTAEAVATEPEEFPTQQTKPVEAGKGEYTFEELGLSQISDIDIPEGILFDENGIPLNYSEKLTGRATAYCMGHTTATGTSVHEGVVAIDPRIIPYGSTMYIVADDGSIYGYSSAEDTGGFIYWDNAPLVDLYVNTVDIAYQWGNRAVTIYIF